MLAILAYSLLPNYHTFAYQVRHFVIGNSIKLQKEKNSSVMSSHLGQLPHPTTLVAMKLGF